MGTVVTVRQRMGTVGGKSEHIASCDGDMHNMERRGRVVSGEMWGEGHRDSVVGWGAFSIHSKSHPCDLGNGENGKCVENPAACKVQGPIGPIPVIQNAEYVI